MFLQLQVLFKKSDLSNCDELKRLANSKLGLRDNSANI